MRWWRRKWIEFCALIATVIGSAAAVYQINHRPDAPVKTVEAPVHVEEPHVPPVVRVPVTVRKVIAASAITPIRSEDNEAVDLAYCGEPRLESLAVNYEGIKVTSAGCTRTTCYVVSDPARFEPNQIDLYRWPSKDAPPVRHRATFPVDEAAFEKISPYFEEAVVTWHQQGSGGYLDLRILLWVNDEWHELTGPVPQAAGQDGDFEFYDGDGDDIQELRVSYGRYEPKTEVFRFDDVLLTFERTDG